MILAEPFVLLEGQRVNHSWVVAASSALALLVLFLAFVREVRLRRALQQLLQRLLRHWKGQK